VSASEHEQLVAVFVRLGASPAQAGTMARQMTKRCDQWVAERGLDRVTAMGRLLQLVTLGSQGEPPPGFEGVSRQEPPGPGGAGSSASSASPP
jgi:hypothetical protein